ncbi:hypothetical protein COCNU_06G011600 [Cocos nucifera]|uniref:Uncharacterized protein n=1 Tax=Cocos nucifera TaxID=13894 RepID=A0A8K0N371_COCNU|nr:hypothetical protein COCNU_06G011600 [Cocos nucifera]
MRHFVEAVCGSEARCEKFCGLWWAKNQKVEFSFIRWVFESPSEFQWRPMQLDCIIGRISPFVKRMMNGFR